MGQGGTHDIFARTQRKGRILKFISLCLTMWHFVRCAVFSLIFGIFRHQQFADICECVSMEQLDCPLRPWQSDALYWHITPLCNVICAREASSPTLTRTTIAHARCVFLSFTVLSLYKTVAWCPYFDRECWNLWNDFSPCLFWQWGSHNTGAILVWLQRL